jgi:hypothetical protein
MREASAIRDVRLWLMNNPRPVLATSDEKEDEEKPRKS